MAIFTAIAAAISAISAWTIGGFAIGATLLQAAAEIGLNLLAKALAGEPEKPTFSIQGKLQSGGDLPRSFQVGFTATAGSLVYANEWGNSSKTPNAYSVQVIALSDLPISELVEVWVNGEKVTLDATAHAEYGRPVLEYRLDGKDFLWIKFHDGTQTEVDHYLVDKFLSSERPYEATRVGYGVAYVVCTSRVQEELFTGFPQFKFAVNGIKLYDPSKDATVGGIGPHRWDDRSTWGGDGDHLPVVQTYNLLRGITYADQWLYGLQNMPAARLPVDHWIAQIAKCRLSNASTGNKPIYRSGGEIQVNAQITEAISAMMTTCQGKVSEIGGVYKAHVGAPGTASFSFDDDEIVSTAGQSFTPFFGLADTINGISAKYPSPDEGWNTKVAPPLYSSQFEVEDGHRRLMADVSLDFVPYPAQVQRLMKSALEEARRARRQTFVLPPAYFGIEPGDIVSWTSARNGYVNKLFRVDGVIDDANLDVMVDLTEVDPVDYDWDQEVDYRAPVDGYVGKPFPPPQPMQGWVVEPYEIRDSSSRNRRPGIKVKCASDQDDVQNVRVKVRLKSSEAVVFDSDATPYDDPYEWVLSGQWTLPDTLYQASGRFLPYSDRRTEWSAWIDVTTPNIQLIADDILDGAIISAKINDAAIIASKIATDAVTSIKIAAGAVAEAKIAVDAVTRNNIKNGEIIAAKIAAGAVELTKFASGLTPVEGPFATAPVTGNFEGRVATIGASPNAKLMRYTGGAWTSAVPAVDLTGQITTTQISDNAITTPKITAGAVVTASLAAGAVTATTIATDAVTAIKIQANAISADKIAANVIGAKHIIVTDFENLILDGMFNQVLATFDDVWVPDAGTVFNGSVGPAPGTGEFVWAWSGDALTGTRVLVLDNTTSGGSGQEVYVTSKDFMPCTTGDVLAWEIANKTTYEVSATGLYFTFFWCDRTGATLSTQHVVSNQGLTNSWVVRSGQVTVPASATQFKVRMYLSSHAVTRNNLIDRIIVRKAKGASLIVDGTIITNHLAADSITTAKIAAGAITATEIATNAVTAVKIQAGTITGDKIAAATIYSDLLVASSITARELVLTDYSNVYPDYDMGAAAGFYTGAAYTIVGTTNTSYGKNYLRIAGPNAAEANTYSDWVTCEPGEYYVEGVCGMTATAAGTGQCIMYVQRGTIDGAGVVTAVDNILFANKVDSGSSVRQGVAFTMDVGQRAMRIRFRRVAGGTNAATYGGIMIRKRYGANLIVDGAITADHLAVNSIEVGSAAIATGAITNVKIANGAITAAKITAGTITADKMNVTNLAAISATLGNVDISSANIGTLTVGTSNIAAGAVTLADTNVLAASSWSGGSRDVSVTVAHGTGSPTVIVLGQAECHGHPTGVGGIMTLSTRAGSSTIASYRTDFGQNDWVGGSVVGVHVPASGTSSTTYTVRMSAGDVDSAGIMNIAVLVLKR